MKLTHLTSSGTAQMVDVSSKEKSHREATASGKIYLQSHTVELIKERLIKQGDVLAVARVAAINAAKKTSSLIPLCHNISLDHIDVQFFFKKEGIEISVKVVCEGKTGVEMEALSGVSIAALTIYDICKAVDKEMTVNEISLKGKKKNAIQN